MRRVIVIALAAGAFVLLAAVIVWRGRGVGPAEAGDVELSLFEPHAGGCVWSRAAPGGGEARRLAQFSNDCANVQVIYEPGGKRALVWFMQTGFSSPDDLLYLVDTVRAKATRLPLPEVGDPQLYMWTDAGLLCLSANQQITLETLAGDSGEQTFITWRGRRWATPPMAASGAESAPDNGQDILVHALTMDPAAVSPLWTLLDTQPSRAPVNATFAGGPWPMGADGATTATGIFAALASFRAATAALPDWRRWQSFYLLRHPPMGQRVAAPAAVHLSGHNIAWYRWQPAAWRHALLFPVETAGTQGAESGPPLGRIYLSNPTASDAAGEAAREEARQVWLPLPGPSYGEHQRLQLTAQGPYMLVTEYATGMEPRLYDMRSGQVVYSSAVAGAVTFWPR